MHEFHGDLLVGGARLKHIHVELEQEQPQDGTKDWILCGHLHLSPEQIELLQTDRPYRLLLDDGRAGQVVVSKIEPEDNSHLLVDFESQTRSRPR
jgi:hypothetical protein